MIIKCLVTMLFDQRITLGQLKIMIHHLVHHLLQTVSGPLEALVGVPELGGLGLEEVLGLLARPALPLEPGLPDVVARGHLS